MEMKKKMRRGKFLGFTMCKVKEKWIKSVFFFFSVFPVAGMKKKCVKNEKTKKVQKLFWATA